MTSTNFYNAGAHPYEHVNQDNAGPEQVSEYEDLNNSVVNTNRDDSYVVPEQPANSCNPETLESHDIEEPVNFESTSNYSIDANDHENSMGVSEEEVLTLPQDATPFHFHGDVHMIQHDVDSVQQDVSGEPIDQDENMRNDEYCADSSREMVVDETVDISENVEEIQTAPSVTAHVGILSSVVQNVSSETCSEVETSRPTTQVAETNSTADQHTVDTQQTETSETKEGVEETESPNHQNGDQLVVQNETPTVQMCIRKGCINPAVNNPEWEQEFCSNDCVVIHCRNVFMAWVKANEVMSQ